MCHQRQNNHLSSQTVPATCSHVYGYTLQQVLGAQSSTAPPNSPPVSYQDHCARDREAGDTVAKVVCICLVVGVSDLLGYKHCRISLNKKLSRILLYFKPVFFHNRTCGYTLCGTSGDQSSTCNEELGVRRAGTGAVVCCMPPQAEGHAACEQPV